MPFRNILRIIRKNKLDFFLNLTGLSVAMLIFIFVSLYVKNELTYDNYHPDSDRIFRLTTSLISPSGQNTYMALANPPFAQILKDQCPEIEEMVCVETESVSSITYNETEFKDISIRAATPSIFQMFSYPFILGDPSKFLKAPNTIVLTESLSKRVFGDSTPLGRKITIDKNDYEVTGVIEDLPSNTDLQFSALVSSDFDGTGELFDWGNYYVYLRTVNPEVSELKNKIDRLTTEKYSGLEQDLGDFKLVHNLQPLESIHFENSLLADSPKGNKTTVYAFSVVAFLVLIIAGINYTNLTLAQLDKREQEFNIRKTIGCGKQWVYYHIVSESVLNVVFAAIVSIALATVFYPVFNQLFEKDFSIISVLRMGAPVLGVFLLFGVVTGLYPAFRTTRSASVKKSGFGLFGKSLVTFQNTVAIVMIAGLLMIWSQIRFMKNAELGFNKEQLVSVAIPSKPEKFPGKEVIRQELSSLSEVNSLAFGGGGTNLGSSSNWMKSIMAVQDDNGDDIQFVLNQPQIDENYIDLFGIEMLQGRNFSASNSADEDRSVIINETYAKTMGWDEPLGKILDETPPQKIVGVVKDFHFDALNNPIEPLKFVELRDQPAYVFLKTEPKNIKVIQQKWESIYPDEPFEFQFMDEHMAGLYMQNEKEMTIFSWLTLVAVLISCLGIYGLASHFIINRTKEIGIRKVNGAKIGEVISLLNKGFIRWIVIAFVVATPVSYFIMQKWLQNFAYKTNLSWWIFALAGILALGIALITVSWQSWRAATRNPVEALRYE